MDDFGNIIVGDSDLYRIQIFDQGYNFLYRFGSRGINEGQFDVPIGIAVNSLNDILIADTFNHRIQVYTEDFLPAGPVPPDAGPPEGAGPPPGRGKP